MNHLVGPIPRHQYVWVDSRFTHREPCGLLRAVWFGLVSHPGRMWGCNVLLESGAIYRNLPPHALVLHEGPTPELWTPQDAQEYDCYGLTWSALIYPYLDGLECLARANGVEYLGEYLFTACPIGDGFSAYPEQAKEFSFIRLDNGRLTIQPTNHVVFKEVSFTDHVLAFPKGLKRQTKVWACE